MLGHSGGRVNSSAPEPAEQDPASISVTLLDMRALTPLAWRRTQPGTRLRGGYGRLLPRGANADSGEAGSQASEEGIKGGLGKSTNRSQHHKDERWAHAPGVQLRMQWVQERRGGGKSSCYESVTNVDFHRSRPR